MLKNIAGCNKQKRSGRNTASSAKLPSKRQQTKTKTSLKRRVQNTTSRAMSTESGPELTPNGLKLQKLRAQMAAEKLDALFIPLTDPHLSEYVPEHDKRLEWISEFSGSAGTALVTQTEQLLWTDARYYLQAANQSPNWTLMKTGLVNTPSITTWCQTNLKPGQTVGFDAWNSSILKVKSIKKELKAKKINFTSFPTTLIDSIWPNQQPLPFNKVRIFEHAGEEMKDKLARVRAEMSDKGANCLILAALDEIAWLTNLRGSDVEFNPVFLAYAVVTESETHLFVDLEAFEKSELGSHLDSQDKVTLHPYSSIGDFVANLKLKQTPSKATSRSDGFPSGEEEGEAEGENKGESGMKIWIDADKTNHALLTKLGLDSNDTDSIITTSNPIGVMKATKNKVEIAAMKAAHKRDAAAVVKFLAWFETQYPSLPCITSDLDQHHKSPLSEYTLALKLDDFRKQQEGYVCPSFDTISSIGPNGAIIHYKPDQHTSSPLTTGQVFLLDSGGSYLDATTDITRTFFIPSPNKHSSLKQPQPQQNPSNIDVGSDIGIDPTQPTPFHKEVFTRVLQGHINIANAIWPPNTSGPVLDAFARAPLWESGLDCVHGIGHGVGAGLNVHEGPISISKPSRASVALGVPLVEGMILSNEPGYYQDGEFGVRIENLVNVVQKQTKFGPKSSEPRAYLGFDNLTLVPYDRTLIEMDLMRDSDVKYVNQYHQEVFDAIAPLVADDAIATEWLIKNTKPL